MQINVLGTGHATATECFNTCFTISNNDFEYFLVDSGGGNGILRQLKQSKIEIEKIKNVFISHIHMDHILGVLWLIRIWVRKFYKKELTEPICVYGNDEVITSLKNLCDIIIPKDFLYLINDKIKFIEIHDNEVIEIMEMKIDFFDLHAKKAKQYGFTINNNLFTFIGDETCDKSIEKLLYKSEWLWADAYMAGEEAEKYDPISKHHHSTVKYIAELAERMQVKNLILSHTIDTNLQLRKVVFGDDAKKFFNGNIFVPDDLEIIKI